MEKVIWYATGWGWLGLRARFFTWLIRQMCQLHLVDEEVAKENVDIVVDAALTKRIKKGNRAATKIQGGETKVIGNG